MSSLLPCLVVVAHLLVASLRAQSGWSFTVDGAPVTPAIVSFRGTPESPQPGDLAWIAGWLVRLDSPGPHDFVDGEKGLRLRIGGAERMVAMDAERLLAADADQRANLRGVRIDDWNATIARVLGSLAADVPAVVTSAACERGALPALPIGLRHLAIVPMPEAIDLASIVRLPGLRSLTLGSSLFDSPPKSLDALGECAQLRHIAIVGCGNHTLSLAPLASLAELAQLEVEITQVRELPSAAMPGLRHLRLHWTGMPVAEVLACQRNHPACAIRGPVLDSQLRERLRGVDEVVLRVEVRAATETATFEPFATDDPLAVAEVLDMLHVVDDEDGRLAGRPSHTLELRHRGRCVARLDRIGSNLRWRDGPWSGDAQLTTGCAERLASFLARHDQAVPRNQFLTEAARRAETVRRDKVRRALAGDAQDGLLQRVANDDDGIPIGLRMLGCHDLPWNCPDAFDRALVAALAKRLTTPEAWDQALAAGRDDADARRGLAILWLEPHTRTARTAERRAMALPLVVPAALRHGEPWNRARMLLALRDEPDGTGLPFLRRALAREFRLSPFAARRHGTARTTLPPDIAPAADPVFDHADAPVETLAALCLAQLGDPDSLVTIRALAERHRTGPGATVLALALAHLDRK